MFHMKIYALTFGRMQHYTYLCIVKFLNWNDFIIILLMKSFFAVLLAKCVLVERL